MLNVVNFISYFPSDQWLRLARGSPAVFSVLRTSFAFHFSARCAPSQTDTEGLRPASWAKQRGVLCLRTGTLMLYPPPKLAAEKISFSPVRLSLAVVPNDYLCFWNFFQLLKLSIQFDFFRCVQYVHILFSFVIPPSPISFFNVP